MYNVCYIFFNTFYLVVSNLLGKFGIILHESSLSWLEGSQTCSDLMEKKKSLEATRSRRNQAHLTVIMHSCPPKPLTYWVKNNLQLQSDATLRQPTQVLFLQGEGDLLSTADLQDKKGIRC